jgi:hypothetical protein
MTQKPWAVLAYTVADDRGGGGALDGAAQLELKAICDAADFSQVSVAAQVDFKRTKRGVFRGALTAPPAPARGFEDVEDQGHALWKKILGNVRRSRLRVQANRDDLNAASAGVLEDFLQFGRRECPAERYVVSFYGHAYGPFGLFYDRAAKEREATTLRLNDLAGSLRAVDSRAAVVLFRDCFMSTLETACQLRGVSQFMIATQAEAPIAGVWPWLNFMASLLPGAASTDVARALAMQLAAFLELPGNRGPYTDVPYSMVDLDAADAVTAPLAALTQALLDARGDARRRAACAAALEGARVGEAGNPEQPGDPALLDVLTLCEGLRQVRGGEVAAAAAALGGVVRDRLVRWHHSRTGAHRGVSLYYKPTSPGVLEKSFIQAPAGDDEARDADAYARLALCEATGWHRVALDPLVP